MNTEPHHSCALRSGEGPLHGSGRRLAALLLLLAACGDGAPGPRPHPADDPAGEEHEDEHPEHEEDLVVLSPDQVIGAGIRVLEARAGEVVRSLTLPAVVAPNADAVTHVNPKASGIVLSVHRRLGEEVAEGDLLCVIDSVELGRSVADFLRARALARAAETTLERETALYAERLETARQVLDAAVEVDRRILDREEDLQERAVSTVRPLLEAEKALAAAEQRRARELTELEAERDARLLALEVALGERRIDEVAARNALKSIGVEPERLEDVDPASPLLAGTYEIRARRPGIVTGRHITTGEFVDAQTKLYTIEDLSRVWVLASAFEGEIRRTRTGQTGRIHLDAFPGLVLEAEVALVGHEVDRESRSLGVRLELDNPRLEDWPEAYPLRPGMFGHVELELERRPAAVVVPEAAVVHGEESDHVFVRVAPGRFERRVLALGAPSGADVEVLAGVLPGEEVVVEGTFLLESARRKGELGGGHAH